MTARPDALLWTDLETTGLEPDARLLEVGAILTDWNLDELETAAELVAHDVPPGDLWERSHPTVRAMHDESGLWNDLADAPEDALPLEEIDARLVDLLDRHGAETVALAGSGVGTFDRRLIDRDLPALSARLVYWPIDAGVVRRFLGLVAEIPPPEIPTEGRPHRALPDARRSLDEARAYRDLIRTGQDASARAARLRHTVDDLAVRILETTLEVGRIAQHDVEIPAGMPDAHRYYTQDSVDPLLEAARWALGSADELARHASALRRTITPSIDPDRLDATAARSALRRITALLEDAEHYPDRPAAVSEAIEIGIRALEATR